MQIAGSSAIVVGGAGGLGEATVRRLHDAGAKVVVADLADDKGKALESELGVRYVRTDATSEESVNAAIAEAVSLAPLRISVDTPRRSGQRRPAGRQGRLTTGPRRLQEDDRVLPDRGVQRDAAVRGRDRQVRTARRGRPRRDRQHRVDRRLRRPDRPAPLLGGQGRRARHDAGRRPRPVAAGHPRRHHRPRHHQHARLRQGRPTSSSSTGARRCRSPSAWAVRPSTPNWLRASSRTTTSTARSFASTERCASRRSDGADGTRRENGLRRRCQPRHRRDGRRRARRAGAAVAVAARSEDQGKLPGTIHSVAEGISSSGGRALAVPCDVTNEDSVEAAVAADGRRVRRDRHPGRQRRACCGSARSSPRRSSAGSCASTST